MKLPQHSIRTLLVTTFVAAILIWFVMKPVQDWLTPKTGMLPIPDGYVVERIEWKLFNGSNGSIQPGDWVEIVQFPGANSYSQRKTIINKRLVYSRDSDVDGPPMIGVLLKKSDTSKIQLARKNGPIFVVQTEIMDDRSIGAKLHELGK